MKQLLPTINPSPGYDRIKVVASFAELVGTPFREGVNALCWARTLSGNFDEIATGLGVVEEITTLDEARLRELNLSPAGRAAREVLLEDQRLLRDCGLAPILDCIPGYPCDTEAGPVPTDVYSFHVDSATTEADTWLCSYNVAPSEGLRNEEAVRRVDVPDTRAALLKLYGGRDDADFSAYLSENCFDLHYVPVPSAQPYSFGLGNLWRIATAWPGSPVPPCIHRAPITLPGQLPRLLLIS
ncbi:MAG: hypothetical protein K9M98_08380 [Cephaloticoccus sp.]|nr:hypothetical protein [Cephaloticoccus sp.]MCF7760506.1 hypothetical protein [Cephaloticoccus sp.]